MSENILAVTDENFESAVKKVAGQPVFVDFWAPWCAPCRMVGPLFEEAADAFAGKAVFAKYNVDESNAVAQENGVRGIPTILVYKDGAVVGQHTGALNRAQLTSFIEQHL